MTSSANIPPLVEIGFNLVDDQYQGKYHGKRAHDADLNRVLHRARAAGVHRTVATVGSLRHEAERTLELIAPHPDIFTTIGCHPTRSTELEKHPKGAQGFEEDILRLVRKGGSKVVALGECGLDKDRLHFAPLEAQQKAFDLQLSLAARLKLPLFLHSRSSREEFKAAVEPHLPALREALAADDAPALPPVVETGSEKKLARLGVVHSFTGTGEEAAELIAMGFFIGINGCSLKTDENLAVVKTLPLDRLMLETDAPWCDIRQTHASNVHLQAWKDAHPDQATLAFPPTTKKEKYKDTAMVKGRNEPCSLLGVAAVVAALKGVSVEEVAAVTTANAKWLFRGL
ncbi:hypothetical protein OC861_003869 [Tilletia horrida]|nr:hypothetical protein OC861_003869 [Tilletia horrida]